MAQSAGMELDALLNHYFATDDLSQVEPETLAAGCEQLALDFGVEQEGGRKFALWVLLDALGMAPPPAEAFRDHPELIDPAHGWQRATWRAERDQS